MKMLTQIGCLLFCFTVVNGVEHIIYSDGYTNWGVWGSLNRCPTGSFVTSFSQKTEADQGIFSDDTAMNAIQLNCAPASNPNNITQSITSTVGPRGSWGNLYSCIPSFLSGFNLKVEPDAGPADDTATNSFRGVCTDGRKIDAAGGAWGTWRTERNCDSRHAVCGIQTQVEPDQGSGDDTSLNNIALVCCPLPNMAETCTPEARYKEVTVCDNTYANSESECPYEFEVGVGYAQGSEEAAKGWEGAGFALKDAIKHLPQTFEKNLKDQKTKNSFTAKVFSEKYKVSSSVTVPAGVKTTISYLAADCAHYNVATKNIKREDVSKASQVVAVSFFDI